jgi:type I restriction enzyme S subunit
MSKALPINKFTSKVGSGATPKGGKEAYLGGNYSLIRSQNVHDFIFSNDGLAYINDAQAKKLDNVEVKKGDVLLNITGDSIARCCSVPNDILPARVNQHVSIIRCTNIEDSEYLKYYLINLKSYLMQICGVGGTRNALTKEAVEKLIVKFQDNHTELANILSSLDSKIELNNKINKELEAMAKTLYDYWFVQFDFPDINGKPYKSSGGKMVYNKELKREIPDGWGVDYIDNILGKVEYSEKINTINILEKGKIPVIDQSTNYIAGFTNNIKSIIISNEDNPKIIFGDHTRIIKLINFNFARGADGTQIMISKDERMPQHLFYHSLLKIDLSNYGYARHYKFLKQTKIILPDNKISINYEMRASIWFKSIRDNLFQNQELAKLRDWLLPMLMNGQVKVNSSYE